MSNAARRLVKQHRAGVIAIKREAAGSIRAAWNIAQQQAAHPIATLADAYAKELERIQAEAEDTAARVSPTWLQSPAGGNLRSVAAGIGSAAQRAAAYSSSYTLMAQTRARTQATQDAPALLEAINPPEPDSPPVTVKPPALSPVAAPSQSFDRLASVVEAEALKKARAIAAVGGDGAAMANALTGTLTSGTGQAIAASDGDISSMYRMTITGYVRANPHLTDGWTWEAELASACAGCIAMHGTFHSWDEDIDDHAHGNCMQVPYVGDVPDDIESGVDWLGDQSDATQQDILGPSKYLAYKAGDLELYKLADVTDGYVSEASLKSLGLDAGDYTE